MKLKGKELVKHLRRNHDNVFNHYEAPTWIEMIEEKNDLEGVICGIEDLIVQYEDLAVEIERHIEPEIEPEIEPDKRLTPENVALIKTLTKGQYEKALKTAEKCGCGSCYCCVISDAFKPIIEYISHDADRMYGGFALDENGKYTTARHTTWEGAYQATCDVVAKLRGPKQ